MSQSLAKPLRTQLENTVKTARDWAEKGARAAMAQLGVGEGRVPDYLEESQRILRRRLRAHGRALGDAKASDDTQGLQHLVWETAYGRLSVSQSSVPQTSSPSSTRTHARFEPIKHPFTPIL